MILFDPFGRPRASRQGLLLLAALLCVGLAGCDSGALDEDGPGTRHSLDVRPEDRCSSYNAGDYRYSPSVEQKIVDRQGGIYSPYEMRFFDSTRDTDIEHIVARSEAHDSGMCSADSNAKRAFAEDLLNLTLASPRLNRHVKSAKDAAEWLPDHNKCWYANTIVRVKGKYDLSVDAAESNALNKVLQSCTDFVMKFPKD